MTPFRKLFAVAATMVIATGGAVLLAGPALAQQPARQPIQRKQYFAGQVNGNTAQSVLSVLGCPAPTTVTPAAGSADGHPMPGQTVDVIRFVVPPPVAIGSDFLGYTGQAHKVSVDLIVNLTEPPLSYERHIADLTAYDTTAAIPTTVSLPCSGATYSMVFSPVNGGKKAIGSTVSLTLGIPRIVTVPTPAAAATTILLRGMGFVPATTYTVAECSETSWVVPQDPCIGTNNVTVTTDTTGAFTHTFAPVPCTVVLPSTCYVGVPLPSGVDTVQLVGADKIIVP